MALPPRADAEGGETAGGGTADEQLIEDVVGFVEVEDEIQLAHVAKVAVQHLRSGRSTARFRGSGAMNGQVRGGCEVTVSHTTSAGMVPAPSRGSGRPSTSHHPRAAHLHKVVDRLENDELAKIKLREGS